MIQEEGKRERACCIKKEPYLILGEKGAGI